MKPGLVLNPETEIDQKILDAIEKNLIESILIMTVKPGHGGQSFMESELKKVQLLRKKFPLLDIQVDGGIKLWNIEKCAQAGANHIVSGTGIVKQENQKETIFKMKQIMEKYFSKFENPITNS